MKKVSVVIPYFRGEEFIFHCVNSVIKAFEYAALERLLQLEFIIVVDCETTEQRVRELLPVEIDHYAYEILRNDCNMGVASSRNRGIGLATGDYLHLLDQDDEIRQDFFQKVYPSIAADSDFILVNGLLRFSEKDFAIPIYYYKPQISLKNVALYDIIRSPGQVVVKKDILSQVKFPAAKHHFGCDDKFCWIQLFHHFPYMKVNYLPYEIYVGNIHHANFSKAYRELYRCGLELWENIINNVHDPSLQKIARRNMLFYKYRLGLLINNSQRISGWWQSVLYHLYPNKVMGFIQKKTRQFFN